MNKAKKVLALLMALCMAIGMFSLSAFAAGSLQAAINAAAAGDTISFGGTSGPVVISKDITINFADGATVWSSEAKPAITIADGVNVTLNGVTAGVTSYDDFDRYDAVDLYDAYLAASIPAIRVQNNSTLTLQNSVVTGGEAKFVSTDIYVPVGAGVETYNNSVVNVENSIVFGTWGVENTSSTVVNIAATSIVAGYMDATAALYKTNVAPGSYKLSSTEIAEAFLVDEAHFDEEQAEIAENLLGYRVYAVVEAAPTAVNGLTSACQDGTAAISFNAEDTLWVPTTITVGDYGTEALVLNDGKYTATFEGVETGTYDYAVDYELRADLGDIAGTLNDFVEDFARDYWPDLNDNVNAAIDHILEVAADEVESKLVEAYKDIHKLVVDSNDKNSPLYAVRSDLLVIEDEMFYVLGDEVYYQTTGDYPELDEPVNGVYFDILDYFKALKAADGFVAKAAYIRDNYQALWNTIAGTEGETLYAHVVAIYNVLNNNDGGTISTIINAVETNAELAALVGTEFVDQVKEIKKTLKDVIDAVDGTAGSKGARDYYNELIGGSEIQDYLAFASNENLAEGDRLLSSIKTYYDPHFDGTKLLVMEETLEGTIDIENKITPVIPVIPQIETEVIVSGSGTVVASALADPITATEIIKSNASFTLKAVADEDVFVFWTNNETGKIWSYDEIIKISPTNNKSLRAVFMEDTDEGNFIFLDQSNTYLDSGDSLDEAPSVPQTLYNGTREFSEWKRVAVKGENIEIYKPVYKNSESAVAFNVSIVEGGVLWNNDAGVAYDETTNSYPFRELVYVVANDEDNFSYWTDQDDNILSYSKEYSFVAVRNVELKAVFNGAVGKDIAMNTFFNLDESGTLNIFAERAITADSTKKVIEVGTLLCVKTAEAVPNADILVGAAGVTRAVDKVTGANYPANGTYWVTVSSANVATLTNLHRAARARGYVVYRDTETGIVDIEYSPVATYPF